jgi:predicted lactoylglutathione lyase
MIGRPRCPETRMPRQIFVNLPVADLERSKAFFAALGFACNPDFTNESAASMVVSDTIFVMLLVRPFFATFTDKPIADANAATQVLLCLSCDSDAEVDDFVARARAAGGRVPRAAQDLGFMYGHGFEDPDGHQWELVHMRQGTPA